MTITSRDDAGAQAGDSNIAIAHNNSIAGAGVIVGAVAFPGAGAFAAENGVFDGTNRVYSVANESALSPTSDQKAALDAANSPAAGNAFVTQNDLGESAFGVGRWTWAGTGTGTTPAAGTFRSDAATLGATTSLRIHDLNQDNQNIGAVLNSLIAGDRLYIQPQVDKTDYAFYVLTEPPIDNGTDVTFNNLTVEDSNGSWAAQPYSVVTLWSGTGGGGSVTNPPSVKGDLWTFDGTLGDTNRLPVGTASTQVLKPRTSTDTGLIWENILGATATGGTIAETQSNGAIQDSGVDLADVARTNLAESFDVTVAQQGVNLLQPAAGAALTTSFTVAIGPGDSPVYVCASTWTGTITAPAAGEGDATILFEAGAAVPTLSGFQAPLGTEMVAGKATIALVTRRNNLSYFIWGAQQA